jgi:hypothetical protein
VTETRPATVTAPAAATGTSGPREKDKEKERQQQEEREKENKSEEPNLRTAAASSASTAVANGTSLYLSVSSHMLRRRAGPAPPANGLEYARAERYAALRSEWEKKYAIYSSLHRQIEENKQHFHRLGTLWYAACGHFGNFGICFFFFFSIIPLCVYMVVSYRFLFLVSAALYLFLLLLSRALGIHYHFRCPSSFNSLSPLFIDDWRRRQATDPATRKELSRQIERDYNDRIDVREFLCMPVSH